MVVGSSPTGGATFRNLLLAGFFLFDAADSIGSNSLMTHSPIALLTGASGGIGHEIAHHLDKAGYRLILSGTNQGRLKALADELQGDADVVVADLSKADGIDMIMAKVQKYDRLDLLVNNAGVINTTPFVDTGWNDVEREFTVNYVSVIQLTQRCTKIMKAQGAGQIVTISSLAGILPLYEVPGYTGTKFALRGFMLAQSIALRRYGISVSTIYPGAIDTPMLEYEALHDGSLLNFFSMPLSSDKVARAVMKAIKTKKFEIAVPYSEGILSKLIGAMPSIIPVLLPPIEWMAKKTRAKYLKKKGLL